MKYINLFRASALYLGSAFILQPTYTQQVSTPSAMTIKKQQEHHTFNLRNMKPSHMAYWLDPTHNQQTQNLGRLVLKSLDNTTFKCFDDGNRVGNIRNQISLPGQIERIIADDSQNTLLVVGGSLDDIRRLQEIINILDRPLHYVKIEAEFVSTTPDTMASLILKFKNRGGDSFYKEYKSPKDFNRETHQQLHMENLKMLCFWGAQFRLKSNYKTELKKLVEQKKASVVTCPDTQALNSFEMSITPAHEDIKTILPLDAKKFTNDKTKLPTSSISRMNYNVVVAPIINNDSTVTLAFPQARVATIEDGGAIVFTLAGGKAGTVSQERPQRKSLFVIIKATIMRRLVKPN